MNFFERIVNFLDYSVEAPKVFGSFHLAFLALIICGAVLCAILLKDASDRTFRRTFLVMWICLAVLEVYRETMLSFSVTDGVATWDYAWYQFPFQFCAMPLYILPLVVFLKDGWLRDAAMAYTAFFSIIGGIAVCLYPGDVLCTTLGVNIQSMIHHGVQLITGVVCVVRLRKRYDSSLYLKGVCVFGALLCIAMILNLTVHNVLRAAGQDDTFNMFYVSPYHDCTLPVLSDIYKAVPYPVFLFVYIFAVCLGAAVVISVAKGSLVLSRVIKEKCAKQITSA